MGILHFQGHPNTPLLATSGIDPVVRLWQPAPEDGQANSREVEDKDAAANNNQRRMNADPFETILMNMGVCDLSLAGCWKGAKLKKRKMFGLLPAI